MTAWTCSACRGTGMYREGTDDLGHDRVCIRCDGAGWVEDGGES